MPGGGSGDFTIEFFYEALENGKYKCWVKEDTRVPCVYIDDMIEGTLKLIEADSNNLSDVVYNLQGMSFSAKELELEIKKYIPNF